MIGCSEDVSRRIAIQHAVARTADELLLGTDPACQPLTPADRVVRLTEYLADIAADARSNDAADAPGLLLQLAGGVQLWLEDLEREAAR